MVPKANRVDEKEPGMDELWPVTTIEVERIFSLVSRVHGQPNR